MSDFIEFSVTVNPPETENSEIVIAYLSEYPFDVFENEDGIVKAFGEAKKFEGVDLELQELLVPFIHGEIKIRNIPKENWNEMWEKNFFDPLTIMNRVHIRAEFHPEVKNIEHEIIIQPRMSFGTGHHATTQGMVMLMLENDSIFKDATVLDMGAGTGILAIVAEKLGASFTDAVDIEDWSAINIEENATRNNCKFIHAHHGDAGFLNNKNTELYNCILANIHKQVLMDDTKEYVRVLKSGGLLLLSGFFESDLAEITENCSSLGLNLHSTKTTNNWCAGAWQKL